MLAVFFRASSKKSTHFSELQVTACVLMQKAHKFTMCLYSLQVHLVIMKKKRSVTNLYMKAKELQELETEGLLKIEEFRQFRKWKWSLFSRYLIYLIVSVLKLSIQRMKN